eukprot:gnl/Dysnectes_brevis/1846_a2118_1993.p1 GENE.gnl/Dysnectes_brevis/1846_a2118_1993~~gnl/Dysnectes_brevis/1846_a2118_1993.p1  ORF type:complete len:243 (+),score=82.20 gnl/Dysnectes_brevis/1846_a2118_1993:33-731(+)
MNGIDCKQIETACIACEIENPLASGLVQLYKVTEGAWESTSLTGVALIHPLHSGFVISIVDLEEQAVGWLHPIAPTAPPLISGSFLIVPSSETTYGLMFDNIEDADFFHFVSQDPSSVQPDRRWRKTLTQPPKKVKASKSKSESGGGLFSGLARMLSGKPEEPEELEIGAPADFERRAHVGHNPETMEFELQGSLDAWKDILRMAGVPEEIIADESAASALISKFMAQGISV